MRGACSWFTINMLFIMLKSVVGVVKMKTFLAVGNEQIEEDIKRFDEIEIIDSENDLEQVYNLLEFIDLDFLIINRLLYDGQSDILFRITNMAKIKGIKIIILVDDLKNQEEKKLIAKLISEDVYSFIKFEEINLKLIEHLKSYPQEFDFSILNDKIDKSLKQDINQIQEELDSPIVIEKEIEREVRVEVISNSTIAVISNGSTGKSFVTWNLAHCFADRNYNTSVINLDRGYSANIFYGIDRSEDSALKNIDKCKNILDILKKAYIVKENLKIFTNELCSKEELNNDQFIKVLDLVQANSDITLIDCKPGMKDVLKTAITYSNTILFIFDIDNMHFNLNLDLLKDIESILNTKKTIIVVNNVFTDSDEVKHTKELIEEINKEFKDIIFIKNAGAAAYDSMFTCSCPYFESDDKEFKQNIDTLLDAMKAKEKKKKSFWERLLSF